MVRGCVIVTGDNYIFTVLFGSMHKHPFLHTQSFKIDFLKMQKRASISNSTWFVHNYVHQLETLIATLHQNIQLASPLNKK